MEWSSKAWWFLMDLSLTLQACTVRGRPVFHSKNILEFFQLWPQTSSAFFRLWPPLSSGDTSYSEPLPAVPNTTTCSLHSDPSSDPPSKCCSETSTFSKGNPETSSDYTPSDLNSSLMLFRDSPSHSGDRVTPVGSNIKGQVIKVICDIKGRWWSGLMANAGRWPWL